MTLSWFGPIIVCIMISSRILANLTSFGDTFLVSFPRLPKPEVILLLYTFDTSPFNVTLYLSNPPTEQMDEIGKVKVKLHLYTAYTLQSSTVSNVSAPEDVDFLRCIILRGPRPFGLKVHVRRKQTYMGSFTSLPVSAWGRRYHVITLRIQPYFIVMATITTQVTLFFKQDPSSTLEPKQESAYIGRLAMRKTIQRYQAFTINYCDPGRVESNSSFSGTVIESLDPVGVISGSCFSYMKTDHCPEIEKINKDFSAEMMFPHFMYGTEFVAIIDPWVKASMADDLTMITTSQSETNVTVYVNRNQTVTYFVAAYRTSIYLPTLKVCRVIYSDKPVLVVHIEASACDKEDFRRGGPSLCITIPSELFYNSYIWIASKERTGFDHYIGFVISDPQHLTWNGRKQSASSVREIEIYGKTSLFICFLVHWSEVNVLVESNEPFGAYIFGYRSEGFISFAGFEYRGATQSECLSSNPVMQDGIDNDCDGLVDEEIDNGIDDDGDGDVDEDTHVILLPVLATTSRWWLILLLILLLLLLLLLLKLFQKKDEEPRIVMQTRRIMSSSFGGKFKKWDSETIRQARESIGSNVDEPDDMNLAYIMMIRGVYDPPTDNAQLWEGSDERLDSYGIITPQGWAGSNVKREIMGSAARDAFADKSQSDKGKAAFRPVRHVSILTPEYDVDDGSERLQGVTGASQSESQNATGVNVPREQRDSRMYHDVVEGPPRREPRDSRMYHDVVEGSLRTEQRKSRMSDDAVEGSPRREPRDSRVYHDVIEGSGKPRQALDSRLYHDVTEKKETQESRDSRMYHDAVEGPNRKDKPCAIT